MPSETVAFDPRSRPLSVIVRDSLGVEIERKEYVWDVASRVTDALEGGVWSAYSYDAIDQLIAEAKPSVSYSASYSFDANGNRLSRTVNGVTETYAYDDADKLLSITGGFNPRTYSYDLAGRTTAITGAGGTTQFAYDYDSQVTQITYPSLATDSFTYNGAGARASSSGVSGSRTFKRGGLSVTSPVLSDGVAQYTPGISRREGGVSTFQHSGLKNASAQSSESGAVTASRVYDAYGNVVSSSGAWQGPFGYGGAFGYQEEANGLKLLGHRYYDPDTGRFLTPDPIGSGKNWYAYVGNNPVLFSDSAGLRPDDLSAIPVGSGAGAPSDPGGLDFQDVSDFAAGWGDTLTGGLTKYGRRYLGEGLGIGDANESVNYDSGSYFAGQLVGTAHEVALGGAIGWGKSGVKGAGKEFSHWVPRRVLKKGGMRARKWGNSKWNGNYVSPLRHSRHDPFRYLKGQTKADKWPWLIRMLDRVPRVYIGMFAGGSGGIAYMIAIE